MLSKFYYHARNTKYKVWQTLLVSEPGFLRVLGDFGRKLTFILKLRPRSNIVEYLQCLTIVFILDLQEYIYRNVEKIDYPSAGDVGRRIEDFWDLNIDISLEFQIQKYS